MNRVKRPKPKLVLLPPRLRRRLRARDRAAAGELAASLLDLARNVHDALGVAGWKETVLTDAYEGWLQRVAEAALDEDAEGVGEASKRLLEGTSSEVAFHRARSERGA